MFEHRWTRAAFFLLRIIAGLSFMLHGTQKVFGVPPNPAEAPPLTSLLGAAGVIESIGGGLLTIGFLTRPAAFIMAGEMAVAYFTVHAPRGFLPLLNQGELAVLYCFIFLFFASTGAGAYSVDSLVFKASSSAPPTESLSKALESSP